MASFPGLPCQGGLSLERSTNGDNFFNSVQGENMNARTIKLLHVEDNLLHQCLVASHLNKLPEFRFVITDALSEDAAILAFEKGRHQLIVLDYHLSQGNGLSCLSKLRQRDPIVPILAISGCASTEIAAELLRVGADDYLSKQDLNSAILAHSVRDAITRADAWRRHSVLPGAT
jgi:CheY-like chemotaxis protein